MNLRLAANYGAWENYPRIHAARIMHSRGSRQVSMGPCALAVLFSCVDVMVASAFVLKNARDSACWAVGPLILRRSFPSELRYQHAFVSAGRTQCRWTRGAAGQRGCTCSMSGQRDNPASGSFDPLGVADKGEGNVNLMFNSVGTGLPQTTTSLSRRRTEKGVSKTILNAFNVGIDDRGPSLRERTSALAEGAGGGVGGVGTSKGGKGWGYWGYRALLLMVAAIWGTNFPVVSHPT